MYAPIEGQQYYDYQQQDDLGEQEDLGPPVLGVWTEHSTLPYSNRAVSVLEYDNNREILWAGYDDGRVSSFAMTIKPPAGSDYDSSLQQQPQRYSSFASCPESSSIVQLFPLHTCVAAVSKHAIRMHTVGGLMIGRLCNAPVPATAAGEDGTVETSPCLFTCAAVLRPSQALLTEMTAGPTHILTGTVLQPTTTYDSLTSSPCL